MIRIEGMLQALGRTSALLAALIAVGAPSVAHAEQAWVRGELRLNLRTGPGNNYRILDTLTTGDEVSVRQRTEKWTQVALGDGRSGWVPVGYLQPEAPPTIRLGQLQEEVVELRGKLETVTAEREALATSQRELADGEASRQERITTLERENARLRGGQRWPEWITGAGVLCFGMALGALWSRSAGRRSSPRIRL